MDEEQAERLIEALSTNSKNISELTTEIGYLTTKLTKGTDGSLDALLRKMLERLEGIESSVSS